MIKLEQRKFIKRTTAPTKDNKYYIKTTYGGLNSCMLINNSTGSVTPNCVGYAWGRFYEESDIKPKLSTGNAEEWYIKNDGYSRGKTPKLGAVACWRKGVAGNQSDGAGHVAIVEEIKSDGTIVTSNSAYKGTNFYMKEYKPPYKYSKSEYTFQGFIYPPVEFVEKLPVKQYGTPITRNEYSFQIEVLTTDLRARKTPNGEVLGYINKGIYNIAKSQQEGDYLWFEVEPNIWIAYNDKWAILYEPKKQEEIIEEVIEEVEQEEKPITPIEEEIIKPEKLNIFQVIFEIIKKILEIFKKGV